MQRPALLITFCLLVGQLVLATVPPGSVFAASDGSGVDGRLWLPGEQALQQAIITYTRGRIRPLLWPRRLPKEVTEVRSLAPLNFSGQPGVSGSFLLEYRSADGTIFARFGAYRPADLPTGAQQKLSVRNHLPATIVEGMGDAAGQTWLWWAEPGRWQPPGTGDTPLPSVEYLVHARGITRDEVLGLVHELIAIEGPWAYVRGRLPSEVLVLRPTWLPSRFQGMLPSVSVGIAGGEIGPSYVVGYSSSDGGTLLFALRTWNAAAPDMIERATIRGMEGQVTTSAKWWPPLAVYWTEGGRDYAVQAKGVTRDEMLRIVANLTPVSTDVPATTVEALPRTGTMASAILATGTIGALLVGLGFVLRELGLQDRRLAAGRRLPSYHTPSKTPIQGEERANTGDQPPLR